MTASVFIGLRGAAVALLGAATALAGGRIYANRETPLASGVATGIWVYLDDAEPVESGPCLDGGADWQTTLRIVCKARASANGNAVDVADALGVDVFARLMAEPTLGGLADGLQPGPISWAQAEVETDVATCTLQFIAQHTTAGAAIS